MTLNCIKCKEPYETNDPDPYYCTGCAKMKNQLAEEIDRKIGNRPAKKIKSALEIYDEAQKVRGFPRASDLGL